jgi:hypothetical protein
MYQAPQGDPGKELYMGVTTPRLAAEAEINRSDTPSFTTSPWFCPDHGSYPPRTRLAGDDPAARPELLT